MTEKAIEALKSFDWGMKFDALKPIEDAIIATHGDSAARLQLEGQLTAALQGKLSRSAIDYVCRKLRVIGSAASVPALAALLSQEKHSHMARYALESIDVPEAAAALRDGLAKLSGKLKIGVISSLGVRQDAKSVKPLSSLLGDGNVGVAQAAAGALGAIRSAEAAQAISSVKPTGPVKAAVTDASLACAESLLASGKKSAALAIYKGVATSNQPKHVRLAATRGMLACAGK